MQEREKTERIEIRASVAEVERLRRLAGEKSVAATIHELAQREDERRARRGR